MNKKISAEKIFQIDLNSGQTEANENMLTKEIFLDEYGNTIKEISYNPPGIIDQTIESKYDDQNRIIEESCFDEEDELLEKTLFFWNEKDKKIKEEKHYLDGSIDTTTFTYNDDANLTEKICKDDEGEIESKEVFTYKNKRLHEHIAFGEDEKIVEKKTFEFEEDKLISETHLDADEGDETRKEFRYDIDGNIEKELNYNTKNQLVKKTEFLKYKERHILEFREEDPYKNNITKLAYNEANNIILQEQFDINGNLNHRIERSFDEGQRLLESMTFVNTQGQGVSLHFKEIHQYDFRD
jgi:hypothetical protein